MIGIKILVVVTLLVCSGGSFRIMLKAERFVWQIQKGNWGRLSHRQRVVQGSLVPVWFGLVIAAFVVGYLASGKAVTAAETAGAVAIVMVAIGPFIGFAIGRTASKHRSREVGSRDTSSTSTANPPSNGPHT